jgi:hypothetical protein
MEKMNYADMVVRQTVEKFCGQIVWLRVLRFTYKELFEQEKDRILIEKTAPSFFSDLNIILHNFLILEFVKITDPATSRTSKGKIRENLTVDNLIECIEWPEDVHEKLKSLNEKTKTFRGYTKDARDKLLAHSDKQVFLSGEMLGKFPEGEDERFLETLEEICNITHKVCFGRIHGEIIPTGPGDVLNLKKALKNALAFDSLSSERTVKEKEK